jgi:hypothetical protein
VIICLLLAVAIAIGVASFDGTCISFEPPTRSCTLLQFLIPYLLLLLVYWIVGRPMLALVIGLIILIAPLVGWFVSRSGSREAS